MEHENNDLILCKINFVQIFNFDLVNPNLDLTMSDLAN